MILIGGFIRRGCRGGRGGEGETGRQGEGETGRGGDKERKPPNSVFLIPFSTNVSASMAASRCRMG